MPSSYVLNAVLEFYKAGLTHEAFSICLTVKYLRYERRKSSLVHGMGFGTLVEEATAKGRLLGPIYIGGTPYRRHSKLLVA